MSIMAWYPLPQSGIAPSAGDEFFENQTAGWSLWSFISADDHSAAKHGGGAGRADQHADGSTPLVPQQCAPPTDDIFMSQLSDEEVRKMDGAFEALDMFPDSMHRLMAYENMLGGVLTGAEDEDSKLDQNGVDAMDTCGFPLFSHDLQSGGSTSAAGPSSHEVAPVPDLTPKDDQQVQAGGGGSMAKRSRSVAGGEESEQGFEAQVLEELEDVALQLTKKTRICFRDAFFRLADSSSRAKCSAANGASGVGSSSKQAEDSTSRISTTPGCGCPPERETNAIDRTVAWLALTPSCCPASPQAHVNRYAAGDSGAEAQSTTTWTAAA